MPTANKISGALQRKNHPWRDDDFADDAECSSGVARVNDGALTNDVERGGVAECEYEEFRELNLIVIVVFRNSWSLARHASASVAVKRIASERRERNIRAACEPRG